MGAKTRLVAPFVCGLFLGLAAVLSIYNGQSFQKTHRSLNADPTSFQTKKGETVEARYTNEVIDDLKKQIQELSKFTGRNKRRQKEKLERKIKQEVQALEAQAEERAEKLRQKFTKDELVDKMLELLALSQKVDDEESIKNSA